jgi:hypothetical protein
MKKVVRLTESDLTRIVKRVMTEGVVEDLSKKIKMTSNKFPGQRSLMYCARKMSTAKEFQDFLIDCGTMILSPGFGTMACTSQILSHTDDIIKITACVVSCIDTGKYGGQSCAAQ